MIPSWWKHSELLLDLIINPLAPFQTCFHRCGRYSQSVTQTMTRSHRREAVGSTPGECQEALQHVGGRGHGGGGAGAGKAQRERKRERKSSGNTWRKWGGKVHPCRSWEKDRIKKEEENKAQGCLQAFDQTKPDRWVGRQREEVATNLLW